MDAAQALIARFRTLLERERAAARAQFDRARAGLDPAALAAQGRAALGLVVADTASPVPGRAAWVLAAADGGEITCPAGPGDPVSVYRRRAPEDAVRALVARRTRRAVTVVFDEVPPPDLEDSELVVEREWDETSHQRLVDALGRLETGRGRVAEWRALVAGGTAPRFDRAPGCDDPALNEPQRLAVSRALSAVDFFLVHGPPGTGKTEVLAAIGAKASAGGASLLACGPSNASVDNLVARLAGRGLDPVRLGHPARVHPLQAERTLEARVARHEKAQVAASLTREARERLRRADRAAKQGRASDRFAEARAARAEARQLFAEARALVRAAEDEIVSGARVVCATLTGLTADALRGRRFDLALVDEATQATVPATVPALLYADRAVFAGDPCQLPPTVLDPEAARAGLAETLHERWQRAHTEAVQLLEVQHRMHEEIQRFPSQSMYEGRLRAHPSVAVHRLCELPGVRETDATARPFVYVDTAGRGWSDEAPEGSESRRNPGEAERVAAEVRALLEAGVAPEDIGVIAPYSAQVQLLRTLLPDERLEIDSVDAFQGREKEAVCVSLVRSNDRGEIGFLADVRRMNVALTRARRRLFVIGDSGTVAGHAFYAAFVADAQARGCWKSVWEE